MGIVKYPFIKALVISAWFSLIFLLVYGSGVNLHYRISPLLITTSVIIVFYNSKCVKINYQSVIFVLLGLSLLTFISSYHYHIHSLHRAAYFEYLCYSISGYVVAITSYYIVKNDCRMFDVLYNLTLILFIVGIFRFFRASSQLEYLYANTAYYYILMPLPLLLAKSKNQFFNIIILLVSTVLCVLSIKRGAIIAILIVWFIYLIYTFKNNKKNFLYVLMLLFAACFIVGDRIQIANFEESVGRLEERLYEMEDDGGSGRTDIINTFVERDLEDLLRFPEIFIGNGFEGTYYKYIYLSSMHNDFLEVFYTLGLFGLLFLCCFYYKLFKRLQYLRRERNVFIIPYMSMVILFFIFSFIGSNFNYFHLSLPIFLSLGVLEAQYEQNL